MRSEVGSENPASRAWLIRAGRPDDVPQLQEILRASPEAARWVPEDFTQDGKGSATLVIVAARELELGGFVAARIVVDEAEILNVAVRSGQRRKGIGAALLKQAERELKERGARRIFLEVRESNTAAISLYENLGFQRFSARRGYYRNPDENAVLFEKKLA